MDEEKLKLFIEELKQLQEKYGIYIVSTYDDGLDYDWEEYPYISSYIYFADKKGNEITLDEIEVKYDIKFHIEA